MNEIRNGCIICGEAVNGFGMICDDCKEAIGWAKKYMKTSNGIPDESIEIAKAVDKVNNEDELTYEEALGILVSHSDLYNEVFKCRDILLEAIKRLRKYERDYANELVDDFMPKTVITGTARKSTEPPITTAICPHCNGHHTKQLYGTGTCTNDRTDICLHYICLDCGKEFDKEF